MASPSFVPVGRDECCLVAEVPGPVAEPRRAWRRPYPAVAAVGALAALAVLAAATWRRHCLASLASDSLVSLAELPDDGLELNADRGDEDALREWLSSASSATEAADAGVTRAAIEKAMSTQDPDEAEKVVQRAMRRALAKSGSKRQQLKKFVDSKRRSLKGPKTPLGVIKRQQQVYTAKCVFDSLQAADDIAMAAANLNDKIKTFAHLKNKSLVLSHMSKVAAETKAITSEVNDLYLFDNLGQLATDISFAVNDCATTLTKNVDALCAAAVMGTFTSLAKAAGGGALIGLSCRGMYDKPDPDSVPHNLGTGLEGHAAPGVVPIGLDRRLQDDEVGASRELDPAAAAGAPAPPRKLLFGGGKASDATLCGVQVTEIMWNLAQAALWITQAADGNLGRLGKCSDKREIGEDLSTTTCAVDVGGILFAYSEVARYLQLALFTCADTLNMKAMCGAGITGITSSLAQMSQSGAGLHYACDQMQKPGIKAAYDTASVFENVHKNFGRRLSEGLRADLPRPAPDDSRYSSLDSLKSQFHSPEELWKSIGYDLDDKEAPFRQRQHEGPRQRRDVADASALAELVREDAEPEASGGGKLLGGFAACPAA